MRDGLLLDFDPGSDALKSTDSQLLRHLEIAAADGLYHPATAEIRGNTVFLSSPQVKRPATVRYAFTSAPSPPNFFTSTSLPAAPFRTDSLPQPPK